MSKGPVGRFLARDAPEDEAVDETVAAETVPTVNAARCFARGKEAGYRSSGAVENARVRVDGETSAGEVNGEVLFAEVVGRRVDALREDGAPE